MTDKQEQELNQDSTSYVPDWNNPPTIQDLESDLRSAMSAQSEICAHIEKWLRLKYNIADDDTSLRNNYRSKIRPLTIRRLNEWRYPSLSEPFLSPENLFKVSPRSHLDRQASNQVSAVLNYQFDTQLKKTKLIDTIVRDMVDTGAARLKVSWEYRTEIKKVAVPIYNFKEATQNEIEVIQSAIDLATSDVAKFNALDAELRTSAEVSLANKSYIRATIIDVADEEQEVVISDKPCIDTIDYDDLYIDPTCQGDLDKASFIVQRFISSRDELEKSKIYTNIDKISEDVNAFTVNSNDSYISYNFSDKTRKKFEVFEYWGKWDVDGDGTTKSIVVSWVGDTIIRMHENPFPHKKFPFVVIPNLPLRDSVYGEADALLLEDSQNVIGSILRGQLDSLSRASAGQRGMRKDSLDSVNQERFRRGEDYFYNHNIDIRASIHDHMYPELPASTFALLQRYNNEAESISGVKSFSEGISGDSYGSTATAVNGALSVQSKRELSVIRRISDGLCEAARMIISMNASWLSDETILLITDTPPIEINRTNLLDSFDIKIGITNEALDNIRAQELSFMLQTIGGSLPFELTKIILSEIATLRKMPDLSHSILNYEAPKDPLQELQVQKLLLEIENSKATLQKTLAEIEAIIPAKAQQLVASASKEASISQLNNQKTSDTSSGTEHERRLELIKAQSQGNLERDVAKNMFNLNEN